MSNEQNAKIDFNDIFKEAITNKQFDLAGEAIHCEQAMDYIAQLLAMNTLVDPTILFSIKSPTMLSTIKAIALMSFESGRLYGRTEITRELTADVH